MTENIKDNIKITQFVQIMNKVFMAYFLNITDNEGVDWINTRPTFPPIKSMSETNYFLPDHNYAYMRKFYSDRAVITDIDLSDLCHMHIEDFFNDDMKDEIKDCAKRFSYKVKQFPHSDFIFSLLPDCQPFISTCDRDLETGFTARSIYGANFGQNTHTLIFEFYCLIMERWREMPSKNDDSIIYYPVEFMTPEERIIYDKQPLGSDDEF